MKRLSILPLVLLIALFVAACAPQPDSISAPTRTRLIIADQFIPDILDGQQSQGGYPLSHELISQPLIRYDAQTGTFVPDLLESFTLSPDGKTLTMKLPAGYKYANGDALDAQALVDAINRYAAISPYKFDYDGMQSVTALDATTVQVVNEIGLNVMFPTLMSSFGAPWNVSVARSVGDEAFAANPVASGPFKIKTPWTPGQDLELVRNDYYKTNMPFVQNKSAPYLEKVLVRFIADGQTRANELEAGSVDIVFGLPASTAKKMESDPAYQIFKRVLPGQTAISMNTAAAPFDDLNVRKAIAMALNREQLEAALSGNMTAEYAFINASMIAYDPAAQEYAKSLYPFNVEAARKLLAASGWVDADGDGIVEKNGKPFRVEFLVDSGAVMEVDAAPVVQAQLKAIGIDIQIALHDLAYNYDAMIAGNYQMGFSGYIWVDPDILTYRFTEGASPSQFVTPELTAMLDAARAIPNSKERSAAYLGIQKYLLDNVPMIPLMSENLYIGARSWVKGIYIVSPYNLILNDVRIEQP
ncbi:MAG: ABC transporter substrate-binding protein [Anaerolineales bacterium]|nr:ABC transporter substrate-binding protein [Anaerolineales bacterium]